MLAHVKFRKCFSVFSFVFHLIFLRMGTEHLFPSAPYEMTYALRGLLRQEISFSGIFQIGLFGSLENKIAKRRSKVSCNMMVSLIQNSLSVQVFDVVSWYLHCFENMMLHIDRSFLFHQSVNSVEVQIFTWVSLLK